MPITVHVVGLARPVTFPDGMTHDEIQNAIEHDILPNAEPHYFDTFVNAIPKGTAGLADSIINTPENLVNLGKMGFGTAATALGRPDLAPNVEAPNNLVANAGRKVGLIRESAEPTNALGRVIDMTGQVIGGGGINPRALTRNIAAKSAAPIIRDVTASTASGIGAGVGREVAGSIDTGNEAANALIDAGLTFAGGAVPGGFAASRGTAGDRSAAALNGVTKEQMALAKALQNKANEAGAPITAYEAVQAITGQNPKMQTQQRLAEQSDAGQTTLVPRMQQRPENNAALMDRTIDQVALLSPQPDTLAGRLRTAAADSISNARQLGNVLAKPYYDSAKAKLLSPAQASATTFDPAIKMAIDKVTKDPLNNAYGKPLASVEVLDAAKKYLDDISSNAGIQGKNSLQANASAAASNIRAIADAAAPEYATARAVFGQNMQDVVNPMEQGQIGKLSRSDEFRSQAATLLPDAPMDVNPNVIDKTLTTIRAQDPEIGAQFIGQHLRGVFNEANQKTVGGDNVFGGAKFAAKVAGNPEQEANLIQALRSSGADPRGIHDALEIFRAQGMKPPVNSATSANINEGSLLNGRKLADALRLIPGAVDGWRNGWATKQLAEALASPNGIAAIEELARINGTHNPLRQQMLANLLMANGAVQPKPDQGSLIQALREAPGFVGVNRE